MADALRPERRTTPRTSAPGSPGLDRVRLHPGRIAHIVDLSTGGALLETDWRVLPGMRVEVRIGDPTTLFKVTGRILRCHVAKIDRERLRYRCAVAFEEPLVLGNLRPNGVATDPK